MRIPHRLFLLTALVCAGCATNNDPVKNDSRSSRPSGSKLVKSSQPAAVCGLDASVAQLIAKMRSSPRFVDAYNAVKSAKGGIPVAVVGSIENKTTERIQGRLDAVGESVRVSLHDTALFDVKDDEASRAILARIVRGANGGLEDGALVQSLGSHDSPDFIVLGDMRGSDSVKGVKTYRLRLAVHDLKTGKVVWEGVQTKVTL